MHTIDSADLEKIDQQVVRTEQLQDLRCPMPILRTKKALAQMEAGQVLKVVTTDPTAVEDLALFATQTGHRLLAQSASSDGGKVTHWIAHK